MFETYFNQKVLIGKYQDLINEINDFEESLKTFSDSEIRVAAINLQKKYLQTNSLNDLIVSSFALTREASKRTIGLRHYDVQILGGLVLNNNKIAEMKTGEGKTLVATLPACLNGITKKGVHVITVNDYLANRDQAIMKSVYNLLGLKTGLIQENMITKQRQKNYNYDVTYVTNAQLTFDFLRDNIAVEPSNVVLRPFNYCIIDEVDSVLIDEAQTPVILSDNSKPIPADKYITASEVISYIELNKHFTINEKERNVVLTTSGSKQLELILKTKDLYDPRNPWIPYIINALKAKYLFINNIHYIIENNRICIVDQFTGRIMPDRRWGDGLHQAIEAKEKLSIMPETETQATITYQHFFLMYPKLSGMTGTAKTGEIEFEGIYKLPVEVIPTFAPMIRNDLPDLIYRDQFSKWNAIAQFCKKLTKKGQPILLGTTTVEKSEMLAQLLNEYNLSYQILNAKPENIRRESEIVAQAGIKQAITIATNMAGRGTDIILGGNSLIRLQSELYTILTTSKFYQKTKIKTYTPYKLLNKCCLNSQKFLNAISILLNDKNFLALSDFEILSIIQTNNTLVGPKFLYEKIIQFLMSELKNCNEKIQLQQNQIVKNLGGLYVIGTERNDSRRIDNQLRGRCGRQGDPGTTRFFLSLEDNLFRLFGSNKDKIQALFTNQMREDEPIDSNFISKTLDSAQQKIEEKAFEQRKNLFDYEDILNTQRTIIYSQRKGYLENQSMQEKLFSYGEQFVCKYINNFVQNNINSKEFSEIFENLFGRTFLLNYFNQNSADELKLYFFNEFWLAYQAKIEEFNLYGYELFNDVERYSILKFIDTTWQGHLQKTLLLREGVGWLAYGQQNPLTVYKREMVSLFGQIEEELLFYTLYILFRSTVV